MLNGEYKWVPIEEFERSIEFRSLHATARFKKKPYDAEIYYKLNQIVNKRSRQNSPCNAIRLSDGEPVWVGWDTQVYVD